MLEVTVGDDPVGVIGRHEAFLNLLRAREPPDVGLALVAEERPPDAHLGSVHGSYEGRVFGNYLGQVGRSVTEACCQGGERVDVMAQRAVDSDSSVGGAVEGHHEGPEEASGPWYGLGDEAELP